MNYGIANKTGKISDFEMNRILNKAKDNNITVQLQVQDLPIFKSDLDIGPYVEVILDNKHYTKIYNFNVKFNINDI